MAVGLLSFSKFLRWLLDYHKTGTLAVLCGFMIGSLRRIWPYKIDHSIDQPVNEWPDLGNGEVWITIGLGVAAFAFVLVLEWLTKKGHRSSGDASGEE